MNWSAVVLLLGTLAGGIILLAMDQQVPAFTLLGTAIPAIVAMVQSGGAKKEAAAATTVAVQATAVAEQASTTAASSKRIARDAHEVATTAMSQSQGLVLPPELQKPKGQG